MALSWYVHHATVDDAANSVAVNNTQRYRVAQKSEATVLQLVTLEVLIRMAPNLALYSWHYLVIYLNQPWKTKWRHLLNDSNNDKHLCICSQRSCFPMRWTDDREMSIPISYGFCRYAEHFHYCRWAPPQIQCLLKFWSWIATAFRMLHHASGINFLQQPIHACLGAIFRWKLSQQTLRALVFVHYWSF